jgi:hypothetical protein
MALAALAASAGAFGQAALVLPASPMVMISSTGPNDAAVQAGGEVVREIDDPHTGARWLLMRDSSRPGGPGRMVMTAGRALGGPPTGAVDATGAETGPSRKGTAPAPPVIQAGDRLIVEENTAVVEARLEAVALNRAAIGSGLQVRLALGGRVVRAVALAPGRAAILTDSEARP